MMTLDGWDLYDITSSGLTSRVYPSKSNIHMLGKAHVLHNFGMLYIENGRQGLTVKSVLFDNFGNELSSHDIPVK